VLLPFKDNIHNILEIGCGNGAKLFSLCKSLDARGVGIDPSSKAVESANQQAKADNLSGIHFKVGSSTILDFATASFDLVYFGFCLYLVDRNELFQTISEADRVLKPGGFLSILDFDPAIRHKRVYHHKENVFSYKNNYPALFTASGHYHLVEKHSFSHSTNHFVRDRGERVAINILYKEIDAY
jgi:ubiquinone/menaquinone biosynthesis C-methylase UbiE